MTRLLCVNPRCRMLAQHRPDCDVECRGCLPRYAADGRNLCEVCTRRLVEDATTAAELYAELELVLAAPGRPGEKTTGTAEHGTELNDRAVEARTLIRHTLASWCLLVADERGIGTPQDTTAAMARYVGLHAVWLSAHAAAGDCADELAGLAHGAPWRTAYPSGARRFKVGPCLMDDCPGEIVAVLRDTDQLLPSALTCDTDAAHSWSAGQWREIGRALHPQGTAGRYVTAAETASTWRLPLGTVHRLASTKEWRRSGDGHRPVLYLAEDVDATMKQRATKVGAS
jgi:hypothetical protein